MAIDNVISNQFTAADWTALDNALNQIETLLNGKVRGLTPEERQEFGSIAEQNKLIVNKVKDYQDTQPAFNHPRINLTEFNNDFVARTELGRRIMRVDTILAKLSDTKILFDYDNYQDSLKYYRNVKFLADDDVPGARAIYETLKQFFAGGGSGTANGGNTL